MRPSLGARVLGSEYGLDSAPSFATSLFSAAPEAPGNTKLDAWLGSDA
jgi:hypothetical protein